ncbi:MAG TPA: hypothetical protein VLC46_16280 [Thermoanaerobaculia bacterium]|jgi:hypothetical protein|nr:hypothetical protein [Thermoanaerobaculia bacterium]
MLTSTSAEELLDGVGEVSAEGGFDRFLGPEVRAEGGQLSPEKQNQKPETAASALR